MIHSKTHPLSGHAGMHHGLANALMMPPSIEFLEQRAPANPHLAAALAQVRRIMADVGVGPSDDEGVGRALERFNRSIGIEPGLAKRGIEPDQIDTLARDAFADACHATNAIAVTEQDMADVLRAAM